MLLFPLLLTLASAVLYALSFPPCSLSWLAWVALTPFFFAVVQVRLHVAAVYGLLWGMVMTCGFGWSFATLVANYFATTPIVGAVALLAVSIGLFGVYYSAFAAWLSWLTRRGSVSPFLVAAGWGACEFARANIGWGNPLALAGYSQVEFSSLMQIADITGPYGVGMLIAAVNAVVAGFFTPAWRGPWPLWSRVSVAAVLCGVLGYGEWRLGQDFAVGESVPIAVIQGAVERQARWDPAFIDANLARYVGMTQEAAPTRPALVFWPEYAVTFPLQKESPRRDTVFALARDLDMDLILGSPYFRFGVKDIHNRNAIFVVREGKLAGRYDKLRLIPFAEDDRFGWLAAQGKLGYEAGQRLQVLPTRVGRIGALVCFEALYPELARGLALQGAEVLANPSNDDWFGSAPPARHLLDIATLRAIENRRYLVRPTATGFSAVVDPYGRTVALSGFGAPEILTASIRLSRVSTFYQGWGDIVAWLILAVVACWSGSAFVDLVKRNFRGDNV